MALDKQFSKKEQETPPPVAPELAAAPDTFNTVPSWPWLGIGQSSWQIHTTHDIQGYGASVGPWPSTSTPVGNWVTPYPQFIFPMSMGSMLGVGMWP